MNRDAVIIGAGIAGLTVALALAREGRRSTVLCKSALGEGASTGWAQGGIAAALASDDSPELHARDTLAVAGGIADAAAVELLTREAVDGIAALIGVGVPFDRDGSGALALGREAAHGRRRIVHASGDATGRAVLDALTGAARREPAIDIVEHADARELVTAGDGQISSVLAHVAGRPVALAADAVVIASGGIGALFAATTNPLGACGDGLALAARVGARLADLEFVQFHPTALAAPGHDPMPLITEALRGEGALLVDDRGERFMLDVDPAAELAPRDVVARAIFSRIGAGRRVYLDARGAVSGEAFPQRFPTVFGLCRAAGIDPRREPIPVAPAAHYHMGGVAVDGLGRTSIAGLWACGEAAASGVHGANRLASNSLLEGLVFGRRVAADVAARVPAAPPPEVAAQAERRAHALAVRPPFAGAQLRRIMFERVGVVRDDAGLRAALDEIARLEAAAGEDRDRLAVARLIASAALGRCESRGSHFRSDHPHPSAAFARRSFVTPAAA